MLVKIISKAVDAVPVALIMAGVAVGFFVPPWSGGTGLAIFLAVAGFVMLERRRTSTPRYRRKTR